MEYADSTPGASRSTAATRSVRLDALQFTFVASSVFELAFFLAYMFAYNLQRQHTISDTLLGRQEYAVVLTIFLVVRALGVFLYLLRYRDANQLTVTVGWLALAVALAGWAWLATHKENTQHFIGVFLFCIGSFTYAVMMLDLCKESHPHLAMEHFWLEMFVFLTSGLLTLAFALIWIWEELDHRHDVGVQQPQYAYIVEHCAYIGNVLFFTFFFLVHTPDPMKPPHIEAIVSESSRRQKNNGEGVEMHALLHPPRASVV